MTVLPDRITYITGSTSQVVQGLEPSTAYEFEVVTAQGGETSAPARSARLELAAPRPNVAWVATSWAAVGLCALATLAFGLVAASGARYTDTWYSLALASGVLMLALAVVTLSAGGGLGMWQVVVGTDRRISTSKVQLWMWTLLVAFVAAYFTGRTWFAGARGLFGGSGVAGGTTGGWSGYLLLLGGPFAALVAAKGIVTAKVAAGTLQKPPGSANLSQAVANDAGSLDLVDTQYLIFNLVAFVYVIIGLARSDSLPDIPNLLLALAGASAATYIGNKAVAQNAPSVTTVAPSTFRPGEQVVADGVNLNPIPGSTPRVTVGGRTAEVVAPASDHRVTIIVPDGIGPGPEDLVLTTVANTAAKPVSVRVEAPAARH